MRKTSVVIFLGLLTLAGCREEIPVGMPTVERPVVGWGVDEALPEPPRTTPPSQPKPPVVAPMPPPKQNKKPTAPPPSATKLKPRPKPAPASPPSAWQREFQRAKARVGDGIFVVEDKGSWGAASCSGVAYIAPRVPVQYVDDVVYHEYGHLLQCEEYGTFGAARAALGNIEQNADCIARLLGATWLNYGCPASQMPAARDLLRG